MGKEGGAVETGHGLLDHFVQIEQGGGSGVEEGRKANHINL